MNRATEHGVLPATLLLDASVIDDPYAFYRPLVAEAPVWCVPDTEIVVVSSYDAGAHEASRHGVSGARRRPHGRALRLVLPTTTAPE